MMGNHFSIILLPTNKCNVNCEYCFEDKTDDRMSLDQLSTVINRALDHMETADIAALTIHWQGGEIMQEQGQARQGKLLGPREFALLMIGIGLFALILATIQHRRDLQKMRKYFEVPYSLATVVAALIGFLGLITFLAVVFRQ